MATEYGVKFDGVSIDWHPDRASAEWYAREYDRVLVAREVSEPRIVSIRA